MKISEKSLCLVFVDCLGMYRLLQPFRISHINGTIC